MSVFTCLAFTAFFVGYLTANKDLLSREELIKGQVLGRFNEPQKNQTDNIAAVALTSEPVISFSLLGNKLRFVAKNGQVIEVDTATQVQRMISNEIILNIFRVIWSPDSRYLVYEVSRDLGNRFILLDLNTGFKTDLDPNTESVVFSPDSTKLAYVKREGETRTVFVRNSNSPELKKLTVVRISSIKLSWPGNLIHLESTASDGSWVFFGLSMDGKLSKIDAVEPAASTEEGRDRVVSTLSVNRKIRPGKIIMSSFGYYAIVQNELDKKLYKVNLRPENTPISTNPPLGSFIGR